MNVPRTECASPPLNCHVETLIPSVMVFGEGVWGRQLDLVELMREGPL